MTSAPSRTRRLPARALAIGGAGLFVLLAALAVLAFAWRLSREAAGLWEGRLTAMADDRQAAVERWITDGLASAGEVSRYPTITYLAAGRPPGPRPFDAEEGPEEHVRQLLRQLVQTHGFANAWFVQRDGRIQISPSPDADGSEVAEVADRVVREKGSLVEIIDSPAGVAVAFASAVMAPNGEAAGAVVLLSRAEAWLFPLMRRAPLPSQTLETLLVGRNGPDVVYLSPPRMASWSPPRRAGAEGRAMAVAAPGGHSVLGELEDYRGERVLAAARRIGGTSWVLLTKVDVAEVRKEGRRDLLWAAALATIAVLAFFGLGYAFLERQARERRRALAESQVRAHFALENIDEVVFFISSEGRIVEALGGTERLYGVPPEDVVGRDVAELQPPEGRARAALDLARARGASAFRYESTALHADGTSVPVEVSTRLVEMEGQSVLVALVHDISERRATEEALRRSEEHYRVLFAHAPVPGFVFDTETLAFLDVNEAAVVQYGYPLGEFLSLTLRDVDPGPDIHDRVERQYRPAAASGGGSAGSGKHRRKDGSFFDVAVYSYPIRFRGRPARLTLALDVSDRTAYEERLRKLSRAVEQSPVSIMITDASGRIEYVNPQFTRTTGYALEEALGRTPALLKSGEVAREIYEDLWRTITSGHEWRGEILNRKKNGELFWEAASIGPVVDPQGRVTHFVAVKEDVTAHKRAAETLRETQVQLWQSQKLEAVGRLAGGVAHDFNNLLGVITGYGELLQAKLEAGGPARRQLEQILRAAQRAAGLTRQLLAFSRRQILQLRVVDLNALVSDLEKMLNRLIGEDVELEVVGGADLGTVRVDPGQMEQVIMNLVVNARDAMPMGGRIRIETRNADLDAAYATTHEAVKPGPYVLLAVSDTGTGMDEATRARVFEPFFTTKAPGTGTGLGLATVYGIVKQCGGYIWVYSELGRGTTFRLYFPRITEPPDVEPAEPAVTAQLRGHETVLVVEDQEVLRGVVRQSLEQFGYHVLEASDGEAALAVVEAHGHEIALVLTDVVMPRLSGVELAVRLRETKPALRVLFMSGYTPDMVARHGLLEAGALLLEKPFTAVALVRMVREAISGAEQPRVGAG
jgi:PAS domain S-box-containing protein